MKTKRLTSMRLTSAWIRLHHKTDTKRHWRNPPLAKGPKHPPPRTPRAPVAERSTLPRRPVAEGSAAPTPLAGKKRTPRKASGATGRQGPKRPTASSQPTGSPQNPRRMTCTERFAPPVGVELVADFRKRLAAIYRYRATGKLFSIVGASMPDPCVVRPKRAPKPNE